MKRIFLLCLISLLVSACVPLVNPAGAVNSGIYGQVLIGPMCPVMQEGIPCPDQPYQAILTILTPQGQKITRFETDADGRFEVKLPPDDYILHPESLTGLSLPYAADIPFTVKPNEFTTINVTFDSGIR